MDPFINVIITCSLLASSIIFSLIALDKSEEKNVRYLFTISGLLFISFIIRLTYCNTYKYEKKVLQSELTEKTTWNEHKIREICKLDTDETFMTRITYRKQITEKLRECYNFSESEIKEIVGCEFYKKEPIKKIPINNCCEQNEHTKKDHTFHTENTNENELKHKKQIMRKLRECNKFSETEIKEIVGKEYYEKLNDSEITDDCCN